MENKIIKYPKRPLEQEQEERLLIKGEIRVHDRFKKMVEPGGIIHIRIVSLELKRAVVFKQYDKVSFPLKYEILGSDVLIPSRFKDIFGNDFYVEAIYMPPGADYRDRPNCPGAEAWGKAGKLYPLRAGDRADMEISFFWTPAIFKGDLEKGNGAINAMWVDVREDLKGLMPKENRLSIYLKTIRFGDIGNVVLVAKKTIENVRPEDLPLAVNFYREDFLQPLTNELRVYYQAVLEPKKEGKEPYLYGLRASPWVKISPRVQSLRLVLFMSSESKPEFIKNIYKIEK